MTVAAPRHRELGLTDAEYERISGEPFDAWLRAHAGQGGVAAQAGGSVTSP